MTKAKDYQSFVDQCRNRPHYFKLAKEMMERHETRQKSILFRNQLLRERRKSMYQNEYDRIRGVIAHTVVPQQTKDVLENRLKEIEKFQLA